MHLDRGKKLHNPRINGLHFTSASLSGPLTETVAYLVVVDDHALELHAHLHDGREVLDAVERNLGDVQKPRHATDLHERSVGLDGLDVPVTAAKKDRTHQEEKSASAAGKHTKTIVHRSTGRSCHRHTDMAVVDNENKYVHAALRSYSSRRVVFISSPRIREKSN